MAAGLAVAVLVLGGCGAATPPASASPVTAATTAPSDPSPTAAGPTDYAAWVARQGFGGSSGLNEIDKYVHWVGDNARIVTVELLDQEAVPEVQRLGAWLDLHPATACWADYHTAARAALATLDEGYATIRADLVAGRGVRLGLVDSMEATSAAALAAPAPRACP